MLDEKFICKMRSQPETKEYLHVLMELGSKLPEWRTILGKVEQAPFYDLSDSASFVKSMLSDITDSLEDLRKEAEDFIATQSETIEYSDWCFEEEGMDARARDMYYRIQGYED